MQMLDLHQKNSWSVSIRKDVPEARTGSAFISLIAGSWEFTLVSCSFPKHPLLATLGGRLFGFTCSEFVLLLISRGWGLYFPLFMGAFRRED